MAGDMMTSALHQLAAAAGIEITWRDVDGHDRIVSHDSLVAVLGAIGLPASSMAEIASSHEILQTEAAHNVPSLITAIIDAPIQIENVQGGYRIDLESGDVIEGYLESGCALPPIAKPGYHRLSIGNSNITVAVAPLRAFTLADAAQGKKLWGLAVQLYALRQAGDGGVGDFSALASFARNAAAHGADAIAISPVHAQFSNDVTRYGPYAPSNRAAYNVYHVAEPVGIADTGALIDWPTASAAKLRALRDSFNNFHDHAALATFRKNGGVGLERHATFEALQASLSEHHEAAYDWRNWPEAYRDPENAAVYRFQQDNAHELSFHAYLQYRADDGLRAAQKAACDSGMKIGLIADLAVGTDQAGSHSWSRQNEILRGLEIGAPPDAINREGQSWGITAFSPRGLIASGYSAFIEMLRHSLRHAGGVRIDHVMGLTRLWLIPRGLRSTDGAYVRLPATDLLRLVALESYRHRAVILGEDLGTLPDGFQSRLDEVGIAGLRVMWFERSGAHFTPPSQWTKTAVAMTSTHDLPTVAGWWQGRDIAWREKLHMAGDSAEMRAADRTELWAAFRSSGATTNPIPAEDDGAAAANAACLHLGLASCTLALLPIEDALATLDQPNLPGTTDEHPNWCRRLPLSAQEILNQPDVAPRLAALNKARSR
jgi:4-alpha-glucanotransferase